jgi:hypothetical protein
MAVSSLSQVDPHLLDVFFHGIWATPKMMIWWLFTLWYTDPTMENTPCLMGKSTIFNYLDGLVGCSSFSETFIWSF